MSRLNVRVLYSLRPARQRRNTTLAQLTFIFHEQFKQKKLFDRETQSCRLSFERCSIVVMRYASLRVLHVVSSSHSAPGCLSSAGLDDRLGGRDLKLES